MPEGRGAGRRHRSGNVEIVTKGARFTEGDAEAQVHGICFKTGPPERIGVELEWLARDRRDPALPVRAEQVAAILAVFGPEGHSDEGYLGQSAQTVRYQPSSLPSGASLTVSPAGRPVFSPAPAAAPVAFAEVAGGSARGGAQGDGGGDASEAGAVEGVDAGRMGIGEPGWQDWTAPAGVTFRDWLRDGGSGPLRAPTAEDLDYHLSTLFPPVRPRGHMELRMIDAQPGDGWIVPAAPLPALAGDVRGADPPQRAPEP